MKKALIVTLVLTLLLCTVCSPAAVSAAPKDTPYIMVYTDTIQTRAHPSPTGNLMPFTIFSPPGVSHGESTLSIGDGYPTDSGGVTREGEIGSWYYVPDGVSLDTPITLTVKVTYTMSGSSTFDNLIWFVAAHGASAHSVRVDLAHQDTPGTVSGTVTRTIDTTTDDNPVPLTLRDVVRSNGVGFAGVIAEADKLDGSASITLDVVQLQINFLEVAV